jgi:Flp pilus assembly protein TadD
MSPRTRRVALLAFAGVILSNFPVLAADGPRLSAALSAWDVRAARAMLQKGLDGVPRRDLPQLWGTLLLLEGEPARAEEMLAHATGPEAARLRVVAKGYRDVTKDLAVAVSPSGRFEVAYRPGPDEAVLPYLMEAADAAFDDLSRRLAMTVPTPVRILVLPTFEDLSAATGLTPSQLDASGAVAACAFNRIHIVSPSRMPRGYPYADTVAHELVHYFLTIRAGDRVPLWLQEGAAKALEQTWRGAPLGQVHRTLQRLLADAVVRGRLLPFSSLGTSLARMQRPEDTALAFAELASFVTWLSGHQGPRILPRLLDELNVADEAVAVLRATGHTLEELRSDWIASLVREGMPGEAAGARTRGTLLMETAGDPLPEMTAEAAAQFRLGDLLRLSGRPGAAADKYRIVLGSMQPPHPEIVARLAGALVDAGNPEAAEAVLDAAGVDEEEFAYVARERGRALARSGRFAEAEAPLRTAVRTDPWDPETHEALARVYGATGRADLAEREQRLAGAWR